MGYSNKNWRCPYFSWDEHCAVHCELGQRVRFPDDSAAAAYTYKYCCSFEYSECSIAAMLNDYYERMDADVKQKNKTRP